MFYFFYAQVKCKTDADISIKNFPVSCFQLMSMFFIPFFLRYFYIVTVKFILITNDKWESAQKLMHALTLHYNTKQLLHLYKERKAHAVRKLNQNLLVIKMMAVIKEVKAILKSTIRIITVILGYDKWKIYKIHAYFIYCHRRKYKIFHFFATGITVCMDCVVYLKYSKEIFDIGEIRVNSNGISLATNKMIIKNGQNHPQRVLQLDFSIFFVSIHLKNF